MSNLDNVTTVLPNPTVVNLPETTSSGDGITLSTVSVVDSGQMLIRNIVTYVGAAIAIAGVLLTLLSYIGYRKFHVKRPHIIMVNLCACLFLYYLAYMISNHDRQSPGRDESRVCLFSAIVCHFSVLAAWFWILVYWMLLLAMFRRPMGGHISHFFIKASAPAYGISIGITILCAVVATQNNGGIQSRNYLGAQCFVDKLYLYAGTMIPVGMAFVPMCLVFGVIMRGVFCDRQSESLQKTSTRRNIKMHFTRLTIITVLLAIVIISSSFNQHDPVGNELIGSMVLFCVASSILGMALMVLFCLHHEEIRSHWVSVIRGDDSQRRKHSINRSKYEVGGDNPSSKTSSTLVRNHPSVYIETFDDERKSSTYRIVAKEDTDMSTLGLIEIPGTPSPARPQDANGEKQGSDGSKLRRNKSDASSKTRQLSQKNNNDLPPKSPKDHGEEGDTGTKSRKKKTRSASTPPVSPDIKKHKSTKRQMTVNDITGGSAASPTNGEAKKRTHKNPKRANSSNRLSKSRFTRKSESTIVDEDTVQLTDFK